MSIYKSIPQSEADQFTQRAKDIIYDTPIRVNSVDELRLENQKAIAKTFDLNTLRHIWNILGDAWETKESVREQVAHFIKLKENVR